MTTSFRPSVAALLGITVGALSLADARTAYAYPAADTVAAIERQMVMPPHAEAMERYDRVYYVLPDENGHAMIGGTYLARASFGSDPHTNWKPVPGIADAYVVEGGAVPVVFDGGCLIVTLRYDLDAGHLIDVPGVKGGTTQVAQCNGYA